MKRLIFLMLFFYSTEKVFAQHDFRFEDFVIDFEKTLKANDIKKLKELSLLYIDCLDCIKMTDAHLKWREENPTTWYDIMSDSLVFIPADTFFKKNFNELIDLEFINRLADTSKVYLNVLTFEPNRKGKIDLHQYTDSKGKVTLYELFVTVINPSKEYEGKSKGLQFINTENGFRLYGYTTVP